MNKQQSVFITGGTGFVGNYVVAELIERGLHIVMLVRKESVPTRRERLDRLAIQAAAGGARLEWIYGDLNRVHLGIKPAERTKLATVDHCIHLGAVYDIEAEDAALEKANVGGTTRLIELLGEVGFAGIFHHVSSIAVAGSYEGTFTESMFAEGQTFPHAYHRTKYLSEQRVRESGLRYRIYRPAAVVGHSRTGEMDRVDGPYYSFGFLQTVKKALPQWLSVPMPKIRGAMNLVPVDYLAKALVHIALNTRGDGRVFHIVDPDPLGINAMTATFLRAMGGPGLGPFIHTGFVPGLSNLAKLAAGMPSARAVLHEVLEDFGVPANALEILNLQVRFDDQNTRTALLGSGIECPRLVDYAKPLVRYYEDHLDVTHQRSARYARYLSGKTVLVTGASRGIGAAVARRAAAAGARVLLVARGTEGLTKVVEEINGAGGEAYALAVDLSKFNEVDELIGLVLNKYTGVDVLIHNAAHSIRRPIAESLDRFHDFERIMKLNYFAPVRLTLGLLPDLRKRRGRIAHVLTMGVLIPGPYFAGYLASKKALEGFGDSLAAEFHGDGVHVAQIYMPLVHTEMMAPTKEYAGRKDLMTPEKAAIMVLDGIVDRRRRVMTGVGAYYAVSNLFTPRATTRALNILHRTFPVGEATSEFPLERALINKMIGGSPI